MGKFSDACNHDGQGTPDPKKGRPVFAFSKLMSPNAKKDLGTARDPVVVIDVDGDKPQGATDDTTNTPVPIVTVDIPPLDGDNAPPQKLARLESEGAETNDDTVSTRGRPRKLTAAVDVPAAQLFLDSLFTKHTPPEHDSLRREYESFMEEYGDNIPLFIASAIQSNKMMLSSALQNYDLLTSLFPAPSREQAQERWKFHWALSRARTLEPGAPVSGVEPSLLRQLVEAEQDPVKQSFLYLLMVTGGRCACIYWVPFDFWVFGESSVKVCWMLRKAGQGRGDRHSETYEYEWSMPPPAAVKTFMEAHSNDDWSFMCHVKIISSIVNGWLKQLHKTLDCKLPCPTSSAFRDHLDKYLREVKKVDGHRLKTLMDHSVKVSDAHYSALGKRVHSGVPTKKK